MGRYYVIAVEGGYQVRWTDDQGNDVPASPVYADQGEAEGAYNQIVGQPTQPPVSTPKPAPIQPVQPRSGNPFAGTPTPPLGAQPGLSEAMQQAKLLWDKALAIMQASGIIPAELTGTAGSGDVYAYIAGKKPDLIKSLKDNGWKIGTGEGEMSPADAIKKWWAETAPEHSDPKWGGDITKWAGETLEWKAAVAGKPGKTLSLQQFELLKQQWEWQTGTQFPWQQETWTKEFAQRQKEWDDRQKDADRQFDLEKKKWEFETGTKFPWTQEQWRQEFARRNLESDRQFEEEKKRWEFETGTKFPWTQETWRQQFGEEQRQYDQTLEQRQKEWEDQQKEADRQYELEKKKWEFETGTKFPWDQDTWRADYLEKQRQFDESLGNRQYEFGQDLAQQQAEFMGKQQLGWGGLLGGLTGPKDWVRYNQMLQGIPESQWGGTLAQLFGGDQRAFGPMAKTPSWEQSAQTIWDQMRQAGLPTPAPAPGIKPGAAPPTPKGPPPATPVLAPPQPSVPTPPTTGGGAPPRLAPNKGVEDYGGGRKTGGTQVEDKYGAGRGGPGKPVMPPVGAPPPVGGPPAAPAPGTPRRTNPPVTIGPAPAAPPGGFMPAPPYTPPQQQQPGTGAPETWPGGFLPEPRYIPPQQGPGGPSAETLTPDEWQRMRAASQRPPRVLTLAPPNTLDTGLSAGRGARPPVNAPPAGLYPTPQEPLQRMVQPPPMGLYPTPQESLQKVAQSPQMAIQPVGGPAPVVSPAPRVPASGAGPMGPISVPAGPSAPVPYDPRIRRDPWVAMSRAGVPQPVAQPYVGQVGAGNNGVPPVGLYPTPYDPVNRLPGAPDVSIQPVGLPVPVGQNPPVGLYPTPQEPLSRMPNPPVFSMPGGTTSGGTPVPTPGGTGTSPAPRPWESPLRQPISITPRQYARSFPAQREMQEGLWLSQGLRPEEAWEAMRRSWIRSQPVAMGTRYRGGF